MWLYLVEMFTITRRLVVGYRLFTFRSRVLVGSRWRWVLHDDPDWWLADVEVDRDDLGILIASERYPKSASNPQCDTTNAELTVRLLPIFAVSRVLFSITGVSLRWRNGFVVRTEILVQNNRCHNRVHGSVVDMWIVEAKCLEMIRGTGVSLVGGGNQ